MFTKYQHMKSDLVVRPLSTEELDSLCISISLVFSCVAPNNSCILSGGIQFEAL
jgi:hypothetical protein